MSTRSTFAAAPPRLPGLRRMSAVRTPGELHESAFRGTGRGICPAADAGEGKHLARSLSVVVSGSFTRQIDEVQRAVDEFVARGHTVTSPLDPRVVDRFGDFVYVASDATRLIPAVEGRHLECIRAADILWLECAGGYVGPSAALEVGFALACGTPVMSTTPPTEVVFRSYVRTFPSVDGALATLGARSAVASSSEATVGRLFVDPHGAVDALHEHFETMRYLLTSRDAAPDGHDLAASIGEAVHVFGSTMLPLPVSQ